MQFYRVYHIGRHGEITGLTNFSTVNDAVACERAVALRAQNVSPGAELWQCGRQVYCAGIARTADVGLSDLSGVSLALGGTALA